MTNIYYTLHSAENDTIYIYNVELVLFYNNFLNKMAFKNYKSS